MEVESPCICLALASAFLILIENIGSSSYWLVLVKLLEDLYWEWKFPIIGSLVKPIYWWLLIWVRTRWLLLVIDLLYTLSLGILPSFKEMLFNPMNIRMHVLYENSISCIRKTETYISHYVFSSVRLGYPSIKRATSVNDPSTWRFHHSRHVTFFKLTTELEALRFLVMVGHYVPQSPIRGEGWKYWGIYVRHHHNSPI